MPNGVDMTSHVRFAWTDSTLGLAPQETVSRQKTPQSRDWPYNLLKGALGVQEKRMNAAMVSIRLSRNLSLFGGMRWNAHIYMTRVEQVFRNFRKCSDLSTTTYTLKDFLRNSRFDQVLPLCIVNRPWGILDSEYHRLEVLSARPTT